MDDQSWYHLEIIIPNYCIDYKFFGYQNKYSQILVIHHEKNPNCFHSIQFGLFS